MSDNIESIGVKFKKPVKEDRMLRTISRGAGCLSHSYIIDEESNEVTCGKCDKTFNHMAVLVDLTRKEGTWVRNQARSIELMAKLAERSRTKCNNCGKMTKIKGI